MLRHARHAMATRFELVLPGEDHVRLRAAGTEALDEIKRLEAQFAQEVRLSVSVTMGSFRGWTDS